SKRDRLERHLAVVAHLEAQSDADSELNTVISQHLRDAAALVAPSDPERSEIVRRLGTWLERSADRSTAVGAPADAARALTEALALATEPVDQIRLRLAAARAAERAGDLDQGFDHAMAVVTGGLGANDAQV